MEVTRKQSSDFSRIFDILEYQREKYPSQHSLNAFDGNEWRGFSIEYIIQQVNSLSCWLIRSGYQKGQTVLLVPVVGKPEWMMLDFACQQCGLIVVPVHPTSSVPEIELIVQETEPKLCITANVELYEKFRKIIQKHGEPVEIFHLDQEGSQKFSFDSVMEPSETELHSLVEMKNSINEHDLVTILYTSGSSGVPKGVMLTHHNIARNIKSILTLLPLEPHHRVLSFLPFSHILERMACYGYMACGVSLYFSQNKESFAHDFKTARPFFCTSVPRVLEKMYDFMQEQLLGKNVVKKKLIRWALEVGKRYKNTERLNVSYSIQLFFARVLVLSRWRKELGGKIRYMVVGAASLRPEIGRLFSAAGIQVLEGYGMTETSPLISMNRYEPGLSRFGTVGPVIPGVEVKIDQPNEEQEGEILVKGANVMQGYFKRPELTHEVFTDGWLRTGDIGKFIDKRFLKITDRKKDIFKTSAGKYIAPQPLQVHFTKSPFIQRCHIIGFQCPFITALIVPHFEILEAWCGQEHIHWTSPQFMVHNIRVRAKLQREIDLLNDELPNVEKVKDFVLCDADWSIDRGELTTTLKPIRQVIEKNYQKEIEKMYAVL
ncbi:MAG: long-chain fatty acid--CoA ligase [Cyclobacteriaceae bacterium]|nr:long-chain fatty acid--CoA ligase [Cyclobacteriaceae bacterium]